MRSRVGSADPQGPNGAVGRDAMADKREILIPAALIGFAVLCYASILPTYFVSDDFSLIGKVVNEGNLVVGLQDSRPESPTVILRPNKYDPARANLAIFNWNRQKSVSVNVSDFLKVGEKYRLMNPRDFFGSPVQNGTCTSEQILVPVEGEFAAFVLLKS